MSLLAELEKRQQRNQPIRVGLVGVGKRGVVFIPGVGQLKGMDLIAAADIDLQRAVNALYESGIPEDEVGILAADATPLQANQAIAEGKRVITSNATLIPEIVAVDAVVEATGIPSIGALVAFRTILARRHIIMLNVETDATVGYLLKRMADAADVVYTTSAGDEPGAIKELYDFATALGFEIVAAGKG